ncbi:hypothetical protein [Bradyrhizobium sp.]|uniref:hypothetical protein n=1 Tax=Bradyrhizobium sp. TaxID=376 RepID=UPI0026350CF9|nr:hypothetical protein [Bradyrhizobium sp.]
MTKKSPEMFAAYLTALGDLMMIKKAAARVGIYEETPREWEIASRRDEANKVTGSEFYFEFTGVWDWFHRHTRRAISRSIEDIEASARDRALNGVWQVAQYKGQTVYKLNPDWLDEGMRDLLGLTDRDKYLRDGNGNLVPEMVWTPPATDLVLGILAAHSARYKRQSKIDIDMNARIAGGVMVAAAPSPKMFSSQPAPVAVIEGPKQAEKIEDATIAEIESDVTSTEPIKDKLDPVTMPAPAPEPPRVIRQPATGTPYQPTASERAGRALSPLEQELLSRLRGPADKRSASPIGSIKSALPTGSDDE